MISNTAQTNTFTEGMNFDTSISFLKDTEYRYAENVRVVTNEDGTTGILQNIEGVRDYNAYIPEGETIIGTSTIKDIGVVITKDDRNINKVYTITNLDTDTPTITCKVKGYLGLCTDLTKTPNVSIVSNYETDTNIKIYFTDGNSSIKMLNIADNRYEAGSDLVDSNGNIINTLALDITPGANLAPFELVGMGAGSLPTGTVQYCYQLFNIHEQETTVSPLSSMVHLTSSSSNSGSQSYQGDYKGTSSNKACILRAPLFTKDFDKCRIISIRYTDNDKNPTIVIVDEINIDKTSSYINYTDTGNSYMGEITVEEFNSMTGYQFAAKTITKKDNRLFAANIQEESWNPNYDARAYRANAQGQVKLESLNGNDTLTFNFSSLTSSTVSAEHDCLNPFNNQIFGSTIDSDRYIYNSEGKLGGTGVNVSYNFITVPIKLSEQQNGQRANNDCSMDVAAVSMSDIRGTNVGYDTTFGISLGSYENRTPNYADPAIAAKCKGYQRDEIYRFGIIFYNSKSLPSPVYWIGDIRMPHVSQVPPFVYENNTFYGQALGINFKVSNIPEGAIAYEIVRCDRTETDRTVVMNVVGTSLFENRIQDIEQKVGTGNILSTSLELRPAVFFYNIMAYNLYFYHSHIKERTGCISNYLMVDDYFKLVSPEICNSKSDIEYIFSNAYLERIGYYSSYIDNTLPSDKKVVAPEDEGISPGEGFISAYEAYQNTVYNTNSEPTVNFATAERVMHSDGSIKTIVKSLYNQYGSDGYNNVYLNLPCLSSSNERIYYPAQISKYYYPTYSGSDNSPNFIQDAKYPFDIPYNAYEQGLASYRINIGERQYVNWGMSSFDQNYRQMTTGPSGPGMIVYAPGGYAIAPVDNDEINAVNVYNIRRTVSSQYGGNTYATRQNSVYISTNSHVDLANTTSAVISTYTFGGDTFLGLLDYPQTFTFQANDDGDDQAQRRFWGAYIPFESSINMNLFNGDMAHRTHTADDYLDSHLQIDPVQIGNYHVQDRPYYVYNAVYSSQTGSRQYVPPSIYDEDNLIVSNRIYSSQAKVNNEVLDNWSVFKPADYLDVDNQYGEVTNLLNFKDRLFYWQDTALGIAAVNERALIQDNNMGQLTLGTGEVLARYDYVTTTNGSSIVNDRSIVTSDNSLYWYDYDKNEICVLNGNAVSALSKIRNVQTYLNEMYESKRDVTLGLFDKKYNEIWFKFYDKSLIFSEWIDRFTSFYTFNPDWALPFSDKVVTIKDNKLYRINSLDTDGIGEVNKDAKLTIVINQNPMSTKVFDNVRMQGEFRDSNKQPLTTSDIGTMQFFTKDQETSKQNIVFDYREQTYRFPVPRQVNSGDTSTYLPRMRGKHMICNYNFTVNGEQTFRIPFITTTYRQSLL